VALPFLGLPHDVLPRALETCFTVEVGHSEELQALRVENMREMVGGWVAERVRLWVENG